MVKCTSLENWRPKGLVGSNPTPSAIEDPNVRTHALFEEKRQVGSSRAIRDGVRVAGFAISARRPRIAEGDRRSIPPPPLRCSTTTYTT